MTFPLVMITWLDATDIETGWLSLQEIKEKKLASVESVGWIVEESEEKIISIKRSLYSWSYRNDETY